VNAHSKKQKQQGEIAMSFGIEEFSPQPPDSVAKSRSFWHRFARRLDALCAYPAKHAVSEQELRCVDNDIKRCRRLMFRKPQGRGAPVLGRVPAHQAARAMRAK
jgi:hypothetical protein